MKVGCLKPVAGLSSAGKAGSSSHSYNPYDAAAREAYSSENVWNAMIQVTSSTKWQKDVTAK